MVLVTQPTHPALYRDDIRQHQCNVCKSEFMCPPPTRHELMASFTGPEIAALIDEGCVIGSGEVFSDELDRSLAGMPAMMREMSSYEHWIRGVYLITSVSDDNTVTLELDDAMQLEGLRRQLIDDLTLTARGKTFRLLPLESLRHAGPEPDDLRMALRRLAAPCTIVLEGEQSGDCGDDHVAAVNLARQIERPLNPRAVTFAVERVARRYPSSRKVEITHYRGGPCDDDRIVSCVVPGGHGRGWTVKKDLEEAITLATSRACRRVPAQGDFGGGQAVRLHGLQAAVELNGEVALALKFVEDVGRWLVRLRNGEGKRVKVANLAPVEGTATHGQVFAVWGDARWSRTQLLGEIARGHWGLGTASVAEMITAAPERWNGLGGRLVFAPTTEMTEDFVRQARDTMGLLRAEARLARDAST